MIKKNKIILVMSKKKCEKCESIQHVWFSSRDDFDNWECPICKSVNGELPEKIPDE